MKTKSIVMMSLIILGAMIGTVLVVNTDAIAQAKIADTHTREEPTITNNAVTTTTFPGQLFDVWEARAPMPTGRDLAAAVVVNNEILVIGGFRSDQQSTTGITEAYNPATNTWRTQADMPTSRNALAAAVAGGKAYAIGGWSSTTMTVTAAVEAYDPLTNAWTSVSPLPVARNALAAAAVDGRIYAIGGWDGQQVTDAVTMYDPAGDNWTPVAPMPTARSGLAVAVVDGKIYAIGGYDGTWVTGKVEIYDPAADQWTTGAAMPRPRWNLGAGTIKGQIFALGGNEWSDFGAVLAVNEVYDPGLNAWKPAQPMPTGRWGLTVSVVGDRLYAIGGSPDSPDAPRANEAYRPFAPQAVFLPVTAFNPYGRPPDTVVSRPRFQVFILSPVRTCLVGNDFASGNVCRGTNCGDCDCTAEEFDPPAPLLGVSPAHINDPQYAQFEHKVCVEMSLTQAEIDDIIADMETVREQVREWSGGALDLQMEYKVLPHDHIGFVAPAYTYGPFEVDDELLNDYVTIQTDFVYVVAPVYDRVQNLHLAYECGGSFGEMSVRGAGFAEIQYNDLCHSVAIAGRQVYEPLIHEWMHNLDWSLYYVNQVADVFQHVWPDWANWRPGSWPACGMGSPESTSWFPSVDLCEWDPDWIDCNNVASAGACLHAGEVGGQLSWYEHVISAHYPRTITYLGNHCRDGRQDFGETGIDVGGPCP